MKTTLALTLSVSLSLGTLSAQECKAGQGQCPATETALTAAPQKTANAAITAFQSLKPEQQKAVREAFTNLVKTCPIGSRMAKTTVALDRLYTEALTSLEAVAKNDKEPEALRKDCKAQIRMLTRLANTNRETLLTFKTIAGNAKSECCGACEGEKAVKTAAKSDEDCSADKDAKQCAFTAAADLTKSWATAMAEAKKCGECEQTAANMKQWMTTIESNKVPVQQLMMKNFATQAEILNKTCGKLACSKSGLLAKHSEVMQKCEWTKGNCSKAVSAVVAAHKLINAMPKFEKAVKVSGDAGCCEGEKAVKTSAKGDCCEGEKAVKTSAKGGCCGENKKQ